MAASEPICRILLSLLHLLAGLRLAHACYLNRYDRNFLFKSKTSAGLAFIQILSLQEVSLCNFVVKFSVLR